MRLNEALAVNYDLMGKAVITDHHRRVGKITDYAVDGESLYIQKIYVAPKLLKSITGTSQLSIDRSQIIEVSDKHIVIKEATKTVREKAPVGLTA